MLDCPVTMERASSGWSDCHVIINSGGLINLHSHRSPGASINVTYITKVLGKFLEHFMKRRPAMAQQQWWFHWDNAPVLTATSVKDWMASEGDPHCIAIDANMTLKTVSIELGPRIKFI